MAQAGGGGSADGGGVAGESGARTRRGREVRWVVRPVLHPERPIDVTEALIGAVAHELWRTEGGNEAVNWLEAERHVRRLIRMSAQLESAPARSEGVEEADPEEEVAAEERLGFADAILALHATRRSRGLPRTTVGVGGVTRAALERYASGVAHAVERDEAGRSWVRRAPEAPGDPCLRVSSRIGLVDPAACSCGAC